jgi:hypothetical protein
MLALKGDSDELDDKRAAIHQFLRDLDRHLWSLRISKGREDSSFRLGSSGALRLRSDMNEEQILGVIEAWGVRKIETRMEEVAVWVLIFTNVFFLTYFLARLFHLT